MPTMMKRKKGESPVSNDVLIQAFEDWNNRNVYLSGNNYRLKSKKGRIAPWSKAIRQSFHGIEHFCRAAQHYRATGIPIVPAYVIHENVRITNYHGKIKVEQSRRPLTFAEIGEDRHWEQVYGWAAKALFAAVAQVVDHPMLRLAKDIEGDTD